MNDTTYQDPSKPAKARFTEYETLETGETIAIYTPPMDLILELLPDWEKPQHPLVSMEIAGGKKQWRKAKEGDEGFEDYQRQIEKWEKELVDLREAGRYVMALRDVRYLKTLPAHIQELVDDGLLKVPTNNLLRKFFYLRATILANQEDANNIGLIIMRRTGVPEEVIEQFKSNFRNTLMGAGSETVGGNSGDDDADVRVDEDKPVVADS